MDKTQLMLIGVAEYSEAKRLQAALREKGIPISLAAAPESCTTKNCKPSLQIFVPEEHLQAAAEFIQGEKRRDLADLEIDPGLLAETFDPEKENARCPACGETFSTRQTECPSCGLNFGGP